MSVKLISVTPDAEKMMAYVARVSNPNNQENPNYAKLLGYCIKHNHWSVFEQAFMTLELETTRGVAAQVLRHRSFTYQEFSQRYADSSMLADTIPLPELRRQDTKNRQNSIDDIDPFVKQEFEIKIRRTLMKQWCSINQCLIWESQRSVRVLCFPSPRPQESICLVLAGPGFIISICVLLTALRKNIWILQKDVRRSLLSSFQPVQKHLSGSK